jgi:hypothetical protein
LWWSRRLSLLGEEPLVALPFLLVALNVAAEDLGQPSVVLDPCGAVLAAPALLGELVFDAPDPFEISGYSQVGLLFPSLVACRVALFHSTRARRCSARRAGVIDREITPPPSS